MQPREQPVRTAPIAELLVTAIVQVDGDALVMHVGERPYVAAPDGPIEVSTQTLDMRAMRRILEQLLPDDARRALVQFGTVERQLSSTIGFEDRFVVVAARDRGDLWIDIRRDRGVRPAVVESPAPEPTEPIPLPARESFRATVIPMTRVRIEVPDASCAAAAPSRVARLLVATVGRGGTALYLTSDAPPFLRVDGELQSLDSVSALGPVDVEAALAETAPGGSQDWRRGARSEWIAEIAGVGRVRCQAFRDYRGLGAVFHPLTVSPVSAERIGLPPAALALATEADGLILIAAPQGHGKTTLVGSFVDGINRRRHGYVVTLEPQVRVEHRRQRALVSQREVNGAGDAAANARAALAEAPDVLVMDDFHTPEMMHVALEAAGAGVLVVATIPARSATAALRQTASLFPASRRPAVLSAIADRLRGVVAQLLVRKPGGGRAAAHEVLLTTSAVQQAIRGGDFDELPLAIDRGRRQGMVSMNDSLVALLRNGTVDVRDAYRSAGDREGLLIALRREAIDLSAIDYLA